MKSRTCRYSIIIGQNAHLMKRLISLLLLFCIGLPLLAQQQRPAQTPKRDQKKKEVAEIDTIPLYNGTYVGVDLYGIGSKLLGGDFMSSEVSVAVNLKNKFIPTIEFGMGGTDTWSETEQNGPILPNRCGLQHHGKEEREEQLLVCRTSLCIQFI